MSTRQLAAKFLDTLEENYGTIGRQDCVERWMSVGDAQCLRADENLKIEAVNDAVQAWLCALTAFAVAWRLASEGPHSEDVIAKVESTIHGFGLVLEKKVERVKIACYDRPELSGYYLLAGSDLCAPAVVCISSEQETGVLLLARLLPVVIGRGISVLIVSHQDVSSHRRAKSETVLSCCLDYLSVRPDVDATRIGVYGDGLSAALATDLALSDHRVAAAVCDGGFWNWARTAASVRWMARTPDDGEAIPVRRLHFLRRLRCPVLVVAGGRGPISISEAIKLKVECKELHRDIEFVVPRMTSTHLGEIENFVISDETTFGWLESKLSHS